MFFKWYHLFFLSSKAPAVFRSLTEGLINSNMQKLTFYAISRPEKLDRIGEYIVSRLSRDLYHQRYNQVKVKFGPFDLQFFFLFFVFFFVFLQFSGILVLF